MAFQKESQNEFWRRYSYLKACMYIFEIILRIDATWSLLLKTSQKDLTHKINGSKWKKLLNGMERTPGTKQSLKASSEIQAKLKNK